MKNNPIATASTILERLETTANVTIGDRQRKKLKKTIEQLLLSETISVKEFIKLTGDDKIEPVTKNTSTPKTTNIDAWVLNISNGEFDEIHSNLPEGVAINTTPFKPHTLIENISHLLRGNSIQLTIQKNTELHKPIHIHHIINKTFNTTVLGITIEKDTTATLFETTTNTTNITSLQHTTITAKNGSAYEHVVLQNSPTQSLFNQVVINQHKTSNVNHVTVQSNQQFVKNIVIANPNGTQTDTSLAGLSLANDNNTVINNITVHHTKPNTSSSQLYKHILSDNAVGNFTGKIIVNKKAQKTDASQQQHTLLESDHATMDAKPELEIHADDVQCAHGTTIGKLDNTALFYLETRGISKNHAYTLLKHAFATEVLETIEHTEIRNRITNTILQHNL